MAHGGSRNRSGPPADPNSAASERKGLVFRLLPREGHRGPIPEFPLPEQTDREVEVWAKLWRTPQAAMWSVEDWRLPTVGLYCRLQVRAEALDAPTGVYTHLHRLGDQLGITPAGMRDNGWRLTTDEVAQRRGDAAAALAAELDETPHTPKRERRLRGVEDAS